MSEINKLKGIYQTAYRQCSEDHASKSGYLPTQRWDEWLAKNPALTERPGEPEPGEGYFMIDPERDAPKRDDDEFWRGVWMRVVDNQGVFYPGTFYRRLATKEPVCSHCGGTMMVCLRDECPANQAPKEPVMEKPTLTDDVTLECLKVLRDCTKAEKCIRSIAWDQALDQDDDESTDRLTLKILKAKRASLITRLEGK